MRLEPAIPATLAVRGRMAVRILAGDRIPSFDPSSLRIIARTAVINLSARRAIWYAARRSTSLVEDPSTGYAVYTKEDDGFYAILGSVNGASSMCLLILYSYM